MRTLVLGAGFLGTEIARVLFDESASLILSRKSGLPVIINNKQIPCVKVDVLEPSTLTNIPFNITHIVYCVSASSSDITAYRSAYYTGIKNVISFAKEKLSPDLKFTFISSTGVLLENDGDWVNENGKLNIEDEKYSALIDGENLVLSEFGTAALVLRLSGIYGEGRGYLVNLAKKTTDLSSLKIRWTNRIHKTDAANAIKHLWNLGQSGIYIVSDLEPSLNIEAVNFIRSLVGMPSVDISGLVRDEVLSGKRCSCNKLINSGFSFLYPSYREGYTANDLIFR